MNKRSKQMMVSLLRCAIVVPLIGWSMGGARAADTEPPPAMPAPTPVVGHDDADKDADTGRTDPAKEAQRVKELAATFGVTEQQVQTMRQTDHMGWGEIRNLLLISRRLVADSAGTTTPLTVDQALAKVLAQRQSGMGIGQIANSYNIKLGDLRQADKPAKPEKIEHPDKPDRIEHPDRPEKPEVVPRPDKPERPMMPDRPVHR